MHSCPIVVDLDGTLIHTDMLHETALRAFTNNPAIVFNLATWLISGKAVLKQKLANRTQFNPETLPYNIEFLEWLNQRRNEGRKLILCTASDHSIANKVADHLGIFDEVIASDGMTNLAGQNKADVLQKRFSESGFDYAGDSKADMAVWAVANQAILVNTSEKITKSAQNSFKIEAIFHKNKLSLETLLKSLRVHQWLKNILLFIPLLASHDLFNTDAYSSLFLAFLSFSLCASSVYIANDLLDIESDRLHPRKKKRPFASGAMPAWLGVVLAPILLATSIGLAAMVNTQFLAWLCFYFVVTCAYSLLLKRIMLVDCLVLALLYTLRIIAGAAAVNHSLSFWLLAFSVFLFLSLAFVKRYAELELQTANGKEKLHGRGYLTSDAPIIQTMGISAGYGSVLVLALYLDSDAVVQLYSEPTLIWGAVPVMLFWVSWIWMQAHRGNMHDDPLVFAVKDKASLVAGIMFSVFIILGAVGIVA